MTWGRMDLTYFVSTKQGFCNIEILTSPVHHKHFRQSMSADNIFIEETGYIPRVVGLQSSRFHPTTKVISCKHNISISIRSLRHENNIHTYLPSDVSRKCWMQRFLIS